jgi:hypothetical protein
LYQLVTQPQPDSAETRTGTGTVGAVVVGIEHIPALTAIAERNIRADGLGDAIDKQGIVLVTGDGRLGTCFLACARARTVPPLSKNLMT